MDDQRSMVGSNGGVSSRLEQGEQREVRRQIGQSGEVLSLGW